MANRILLADDSITIQKVVNLTFADEGIEVVAVSNGEMAERRLSEINPDLVLADIFMPGKNGYELCQYIKGNPHFRHVPVVLLVGAFEPFDQAEARRVQADAHLTKPFESRTLVETVRRLIETSRLPAAGFGSPAAKPREAVVEPTPPPPPRTGEFQGFSLDAPAPEEWGIREKPVASEPLVQDEGFAFSGPALDEAPPTFSEPTPTAEAIEVPVAPEETKPVEDSGFGGFEISLTSETPSVGFELGNLQPEQVAPVETPIESFSFAESLGKSTPVESAPGSSIPSAFSQPPQDFVIDFEKVEAPQPPAPVEADESIGLGVGSRIESQLVGAESRADLPISVSEFAIAVDETVVESPAEPAPPAVSANFEIPVVVAEPMESISADTSEKLQSLPADAPQHDFSLSFEVAEAPQAAEPVHPVEPTASSESSGTFSRFSWSEVKSEPTDAFELSHADTAPLPSTPVVAEAPQPQVHTETGFDLETVSDGVAEEPPASESASPDGQSPERQPAAEPVFTAADMWSQPPQFSHSEFETLPAGEATAVEPDAGEVQEAALAGTAFEVGEPVGTVPQAETGFEVAQIIAEEAGFAIVESSFAERAGRQAPPNDHAEQASQLGLSAVNADRLAAALRTADPVEADATPHREPPSPMSVVPPVPIVVASPSTGVSADLPPAVMEEIVRRVVAQISDAVIREIAWEVVPDIVERVIDRVARESALKKTGT